MFIYSVWTKSEIRRKLKLLLVDLTKPNIHNICTKSSSCDVMKWGRWEEKWERKSLKKMLRIWRHRKTTCCKSYVFWASSKIKLINIKSAWQDKTRAKWLFLWFFKRIVTWLLKILCGQPFVKYLQIYKNKYPSCLRLDPSIL